MLYVALAIVCKKKFGRRELTRSTWTKEWFNYLRMDEATYLELLQKIIPRIENPDTVMRRVITPRERLRFTLRLYSN
jgi:hypothetical protein